MELCKPSAAVVKLDTNVSTLFRRGQIITKVSDVIRELVDNAIDAGSAKIQILLDNYGLDKIEVRDDGHGIHSSQVRAAVSGGHSSKLEDINHLSCTTNDYGFRGEALSSICSFGATTIITKTANEAHALKYTLDSTGKVIGETRTGNGRGTTVIVKDLFALFPVRRNFVKEKWRTVAELREIEHYLKYVGLANPSIYLNLAHNGNSIWNKPVLKTTEEALAATLGIQMAKRLTKCGPIDIRLSSQNLTTCLECYLPKVPIDAKLMTFGSNKMCIIMVNRRRVQISRIEKMVQQYIFGVIQTGNSQINLKGKYPVVLVKIDVPAELVDFNREINKSKVFLQNENLILEELETLLKSFYPVDFNTIKENLESRAPTNIHQDCQDKQVLPAAAVATKVQQQQSESVKPSDTTSGVEVISVAESSSEKRTQNILSFLEEIPIISKDNFSKSPAKTGGFEKRQICETETRKDTSSIQNETNASITPTTTTAVLSITSAAKNTSSVIDRDWAFGRMKDAQGNVMENVSIVRRVPVVSHEPYASTTYSIQPSRTPGSTSDEEFYARLQAIRTPETGSLFVDPPPPKRPRANLVSTHGALCYSMLEQRSSGVSERTSPLLEQRSTGTRKCPRQITLDNFSNWRKPGIGTAKDFVNANLNINGTSSPGASTIMDEQLSKSPIEDNWVRGTDSLSWGSFTPSHISPESFPPFQLMPVPVPSRVNTAQVEFRKPTTPKRNHTSAASDQTLAASVVTTNDLPCRARTIHSSVILKKSKEITLFTSRGIDVLPDSQTPITTSSRVIGRLPGQSLHVVQIDSLLGVFSVRNLLQLAPSLAENITIGTQSSGDDIDVGTVQKLLIEFPNLSTDEFTEEMVSGVFSLLKDFAPEEEEGLSQTHV